MSILRYMEHSRTVSRWPLPFLIVPLIITTALTLTLYLNQDALQEKVREDRLAMFLPENVAATENMLTLKTVFPPTNPLRDTYDVFGAAFAYVIIEDASRSQNVLQNRVLRIASDVNMRVTRLKVQYSWLQASWDELCYRQNGACLVHPIMVLLNGTEPLSSVSFFLRYPSLQIGNETIDNSLMFGSVTLDDDSIIRKSKAMRLPYILDEGDRQFERKALNYLWQKSFVELLSTLKYPGVNIYYTTSVSWAEEIDKNGKMTIPYLPILFAVLLLFSIVSCCTTDWVYSKPILGICGIINAILAVIATLGTLVAVGYPFLQMVLIMPFLIISVSVDNMFLMLSAWRNTSVWLSVEDRMARCIGESAVSIMITALTDGLSFSVGSISYFPAVRIFCTYCAMAVLYVYLFQMTFFVACLALTGRREHANRHCMTFMKAIPKEHARHRSWLYRTFCTGGQQNNDPSLPTKTHTPFLTTFLSTTYANALNMWAVKAGVVLFYVVYIGIAVYGVVSLPLGLKLEQLVPSNSYAAEEIRASSRHFTAYGTHAYVLLTGEVAYHRQDVSQRLLQLYETLITTEYTVEGEFWLKEFYQYSNGQSYPSYPGFLTRVQRFLTEPKFRKYVNDIKFELVAAETGIDIPLITNSKMLIRMRNIGAENHTAIAKVLRGIFRRSGFPGFIYEPSFLLVDQQESTLHNVIQNVGIAVLVMIVIAVLFIPKLLTSLCIGISIISINLGVVGGYAFWGTRLDIVSMITIVMSIGFSVDFVAHVTYHFLVSRGPRRLNHALKFVGTPIIQAGMSTILGVATLAPINSYMLQTFVKTVILVVGLGLLHGLLFLPVILSIFVPSDQYLDALGTYKHKMSNYLVNQVPRYLTQIRNKRMRSYFDPVNATVDTNDRQGSSLESSRTLRVAAEDSPESSDQSVIEYIPANQLETVDHKSASMVRRPRSSSQPMLHKSTVGTVAALYDFLRMKNNEQYDGKSYEDPAIYSEISDPFRSIPDREMRTVSATVHGPMLDRMQACRQFIEGSDTSSSQRHRSKARRRSAPDFSRALPHTNNMVNQSNFHNSLLRYAPQSTSVCSSSNPQFLLRAQPNRGSSRMYLQNNNNPHMRASMKIAQEAMQQRNRRNQDVPTETVPIVLGQGSRRSASTYRISNSSGDDRPGFSMSGSHGHLNVGGAGRSMYSTSTFKCPTNDDSDIGLMF